MGPLSSWLLCEEYFKMSGHKKVNERWRYIMGTRKVIFTSFVFQFTDNIHPNHHEESQTHIRNLSNAYFPSSQTSCCIQYTLTRQKTFLLVKHHSSLEKKHAISEIHWLGWLMKIFLITVYFLLALFFWYKNNIHLS